MAEALRYYMVAQTYTGKPNPNALSAAQRAAQIAPAVASAEDKEGNHLLAASLYDQGGLFAAADRALLAALRAKPDERRVVEQVMQAFDRRAAESFQANNKLRLSVTGPYTPDAAVVQEVRAAPAKAAERALQREATAFNAQFLKERVALVRARPEPHQLEALRAMMEREQAFAQKWPEELLKRSLNELARVREWAALVPHKAQQTALDAQMLRRAEERADTLLASYSGAPELLEAAQDYGLSVSHLKPADTRVAAIKTLANKLGSDAEGKGRLSLAVAYFRVAGERDKAQAVQARQQQLAQQKVQPDIDAAQRVAANLREQYSDPDKVDALRKQAQAAQTAAQAQRPGTAVSTPSAADLQKELGLK